MPQYRSDDPSSIQAIFDNDGESLTREGFRLPSELKVFGDDARPRAEVISALGIGGLSGAHAEAYKRYLETGNEDFAYE